MTSELDKDYDTLCEEMVAHVDQAIASLKAARAVADKIETIGTPNNWDTWDELWEQVKHFRDIPEPMETRPAWDRSSWCAG